jgi:ABC-type transport system involved in multi-copper enzyme maturation permease subunit
VSAVLEQPPAAPPAPIGGLLRAEVHRFRCRRFIHLLLALATLGWLAAVAIALLNFGEPTESDFDQARAEIDRLVLEQENFREQCLDDPNLPEDLSPEEACGPPMTAEDFRVEDFLSKAPFSFVDAAQGGALAFAAAAAVLCFLVGATWIGAEWSSRNIVALLFWETRRYRVVTVKLAVLVLAAALIGVAAQLVWLAMAGILSAAVGDGATVPEGLWGDLLATQGRAVLLAVLTALLGFGLTNLVRNTGAALGIGFVYFSVVETAVTIVRPGWQPWLLQHNAAGLLLDGGLTIPISDATAVGPDGEIGYAEYLLGNLQAGVYLAVVTAVVLGAGAVLFARRDLH